MREYLIALTGMALLVLSGACERDDIYCKVNDTGVVQLNMDWNESLLVPNGVSLYVFEKGGAMYKALPATAEKDSVYVNLPVGEYFIVVHNDTPYEMANLELKGLDSISHESFVVTAKTTEYPNSPLISVNPLAQIPNKLASYVVDSVIVTGYDIDYVLGGPVNQGKQHKHVLFAKPVSDVYNTIVHVNVENITSTTGNIQAILDGMAAGFNMGLQKKITDKVAHEFTLENKVIDSEQPKNGSFENTFYTFGVPAEVSDLKDGELQLEMDFPLVDGSEYTVVLDIKMNTVVEENKPRQVLITVDVVLPAIQVIDPSGGLGVDVNPWDEQGETLDV